MQGLDALACRWHGTTGEQGGACHQPAGQGPGRRVESGPLPSVSTSGAWQACGRWTPAPNTMMANLEPTRGQHGAANTDAMTSQRDQGPPRSVPPPEAPPACNACPGKRGRAARLHRLRRPLVPSACPPHHHQCRRCPMRHHTKQCRRRPAAGAFTQQTWQCRRRLADNTTAPEPTPQRTRDARSASVAVRCRGAVHQLATAGSACTHGHQRTPLVAAAAQKQSDSPWARQLRRGQ
jgi:hypothetical protein